MKAVSADLAAWWFLRTGARALAARRLELTVAGREHLPGSGPLLIAARHYHHLYDGVALLAALDRPLHIIVGLDWVRSPRGRRIMDLACGAARWPVILRTDAVNRDGLASAARHQEMRRLLRAATTQTVALLRAGRIVVVFPEAYPNIDPSFTPKQGDAFLPFQPGVVRLARLAEGAGAGLVPIVPAGFHYAPLERGRWRVHLRFGVPVLAGERAAEDAALGAIEGAVHRLSKSPPA